MTETDKQWCKIFAKRLRNKIKENGVTQTELSLILGINNSSLSRYCNGLQKPDVTTIRRLAKELHCTVSELVDFDFDPFTLAGYDEHECIKMRQLSETYNIKPALLITVANYMYPGVDKYKALDELIFSLINKESED